MDFSIDDLREISGKLENTTLIKLIDFTIRLAEEKVETLNIDVVTPKKAAEILGVSTETLRLWRHAGKIKPAYGTGKAARYRLRDIEACLRSLNGTADIL